MKRQLGFVVLAAAVVASLAGCVSVRTATAWREAQQKELAAGSNIAHTSVGPIEYTVAGSGPVVLGLHGSMGGYDQTQALARAIAPTGITMLSVSRPGYLRTPISVGRTPAEEADGYVALLDSLGISRVAVIGGSGSGPASLEFAIRHPDRCWGLILLSPIVEQQGMDHFTAWQRFWFKRSFGDRNSYRSVKMIARDPAKAIAMMAPDTMKQIAGDPEKLELAKALAETSFPMSVREVGTMNDVAGVNPISKQALASIRVPTLILHGAHDEWAPLATAEMAAETIPGARIVVYPNGDHLFFIAHLEEGRALIREFVETNAPGAAQKTD